MGPAAHEMDGVPVENVSVGIATTTLAYLWYIFGHCETNVCIPLLPGRSGVTTGAVLKAITCIS